MTESKEVLQKKAKDILASVEGKALTPKDRMVIPPQPMPEQPAECRVQNMSEVTYGYSPEQAQVEAMRCLQCKNAPCVKGCPVGINIPKFLAEAAKGDFSEALSVIKEDSLLPAICGRVCPQETQCQAPCTLGKALKDVDKAVSIGRVERFVADLEREEGETVLPSPAPNTGKKVAVVGSGPAGIAAAADLRKFGHDVTIFEAFHLPGGVLVYGIPEFRLPKSIVQEEIDNLVSMGVKVETNFLVGRTRKLQDLMTQDGFDAVFVGSGAGLPKFMSIPGEDLIGVFSANEYLTRSNLMKAYDESQAATPLFRAKKIAIFGGGNVAMDAARTALRLGADKVYLVYRRTEAEMPARVEEVHHAKEEGVEFLLLNNPVRLEGDDSARLTHAVLQRYELGEPDDSGRRRPVPIEGSEYSLEIDAAIMSLGNASNPLLHQTTPELEVSDRGAIVVDENLETSIPGIYAGGDIVLGAATVILAMGQGRKAAAAINKELSGA